MSAFVQDLDTQPSATRAVQNVLAGRLGCVLLALGVSLDTAERLRRVARPKPLPRRIARLTAYAAWQILLMLGGMAGLSRRHPWHGRAPQASVMTEHARVLKTQLTRLSAG